MSSLVGAMTGVLLLTTLVSGVEEPADGAAGPTADDAAPAAGPSLPAAPFAQASADWLEYLDIGAALPGITDYLHECGALRHESPTPAHRLRALHACLGPTSGGMQAPNAPERFDQEGFAGLMTRLQGALGFRFPAGVEVDPEFRLMLFNRLFLVLLDPSDVYGHGAKAVRRLRHHLLDLSHGILRPSPVQCQSPARTAMTFQALEKGVAGAVFSLEERRVLGGARAWVYDCLMALFEPTLARHDLSPAIRFGNLRWLLLRMGADMVGTHAWRTPPDALITLAAAALPQANETAASDAFYAAHLPAILLSAHAQGTIDLRNADPVTETTFHEALTHFIEETHLEFGRIGALASLEAGLPTRADIYRRVMEAAHIWADRPIEVGHRHSRRLKHMGFHCMGREGVYRLIDIAMANCLSDVRGMDGWLRQQMANKVASPDDLNKRFDAEFGEAVKNLMRSHIVPLIRDQIDMMDATDAHFWHCGAWKIRRPIMIRYTWRCGGMALGVSPRCVRVSSSETGIIIDITAKEYGRFATRHYWITHGNFILARFDGDVAKLVRADVKAFFQANEALSMGDIERRLAAYPSDVAEPVHDLGRHANAVEAVVQFLGTALESFRETARHETDEERRRQTWHDFLLRLIPFVGCEKDVEAASPWATPECLLDGLSVIPVARAGIALGHAGVTLAEAGTRLAATVGGAEWKSLAARLAAQGGAAAGASELSGLMDALTQVGRQSKSFLRESVLMFDPGFQLAHDASRLLNSGIAAMRQALAGKRSLKPLLDVLERRHRYREIFEAQAGLWRVRPGANIARMNSHTIDVDGRRLALADVGGYRDVVVWRDGQRVYPANPASGRPYGRALMYEAKVPGTRELTEVPIPEDATHASDARLCRRKRAGRSGGTCVLAGNGPEYRYRLWDEHLANRLPIHQYRPGTGFTMIAASTGRMDSVVVNEPLPYQGTVRREYFVRDGRVLRRDIPQGPALARDVPLSSSGPLAVTPQLHARLDASGRLVNVALPIVTESGMHRNFVISSPYGTYATLDDRCMGMIEADGRHYDFEIPDGWNKPFVPLGKFLVTRADERAVALYQRFREIRSAEPRGIVATAGNGHMRLSYVRDFDAGTRQKFDATFTRVQTVLDDACRTLIDPATESQVNDLLARLAPGDALKQSDLRLALGVLLHDLRDGFPEFSKQREDAVALATFEGNPPPGVADLATTGLAISGAFEFPIPVKRLGMPIIYLRRDCFVLTPTDDLVADLIHEFSHAKLKTLDTLGAGNADGLYADLSGDGIHLEGLLPSVNGASLDAIVNHAPTLEHVTMILAYMPHPEHERLIGDFLQGASDRYRRL
ncbi:hypothetical protein [Pandoraea terrae]|uniref:hypothetical protein n=1 Tax=Pandoraea terrae TaxID=1537710 RepID=UPI001240BEC0|nr:hypothetical protein [Pandoraea terrae]